MGVWAVRLSGLRTSTLQAFFFTRLLTQLAIRDNVVGAWPFATEAVESRRQQAYKHVPGPRDDEADAGRRGRGHECAARLACGGGQIVGAGTRIGYNERRDRANGHRFQSSGAQR